jgi:ferredoxin-type protein NapG
MADRKISRRDLFTFWRKPEQKNAAKPAVLAPGPFDPWPLDRIPGPSFNRRLPLRPPGNMQEYILREACTRCNLCVDVCPSDSIVPLDETWGDARGTPAIDPRKQPCVVCTGLQCTKVCPSGALQMTINVFEIRMGTAKVDTQRCVTYAGTACRACVDVCPVPGAIVSDGGGHPFVEENSCIGCGLCVRACVTEPTSIQVVPRD